MCLVYSRLIFTKTVRDRHYHHVTNEQTKSQRWSDLLRITQSLTGPKPEVLTPKLTFFKCAKASKEVFCFMFF